MANKRNKIFYYTTTNYNANEVWVCQHWVFDMFTFAFIQLWKHLPYILTVFCNIPQKSLLNGGSLKPDMEIIFGK